MRGRLPESDNSPYTSTEKGFFVQTSATLEAAGVWVHVVQVVATKDGKAISGTRRGNRLGLPRPPPARRLGGMSGRRIAPRPVRRPMSR
ncbi:hypothetical protein [Saccharopolyspora elongata]|uniref:Uncharacterized protein n=1 Tax=Saccharopolyspora elongata TaxID=2530387 RepID=A0A4R4Z236_9PSEU|nr:hypothetical protein [Saccharopolyspora elongata]TDD50102.1 hypothetical protein E1288_17975 [Saccharopolyspora elongata]